MPDIVEIPAIWLQGSACTGCKVDIGPDGQVVGLF